MKLPKSNHYKMRRIIDKQLKSWINSLCSSSPAKTRLRGRPNLWNGLPCPVGALRWRQQMEANSQASSQKAKLKISVEVEETDSLCWSPQVYHHPLSLTYPTSRIKISEAVFTQWLHGGIQTLRIRNNKKTKAFLSVYFSANSEKAFTRARWKGTSKYKRMLHLIPTMWTRYVKGKLFTNGVLLKPSKFPIRTLSHLWMKRWLLKK